MPFVIRGKSGNIQSIAVNKPNDNGSGEWQYSSAHDQDILNWLNYWGASGEVVLAESKKLHASEQGQVFARAIEDLFHVLVRKGVIDREDCPKAWLEAREEARTKLRQEFETAINNQKAGAVVSF